MNRKSIAALHAGYWLLYLALLAMMLQMLRASRGGTASVASLAAVWPILLLATVPNAVAFYAAYGPLFSRALSRRRHAATVVGAVAIAAGAALGAIALSALLFGARQPALSQRFEAAVLLLSFATLAAIHTGAALVIRGFVGWYGDIRIKEALMQRTRDVELALIRSRLSPHFLFNTLNNIDVLIARNPALASDYLNQLSGVLRFVLYEGSQAAVALSEELHYIDKYLALERIRTRHPGYVTHTVSGDPSGLAIAPMTFIPFIENAFKHTDAARVDGAIESRIAIDGDRITFECRNRMPSGPPRTPGGLGLELIRERLRLLYPSHALDAGPRGDTYAVRLIIEGRRTCAA